MVKGCHNAPRSSKPGSYCKMSIFQNTVFYKKNNLITVSAKEETKAQRGEVPCPRPRLVSAVDWEQTEVPPSQNREDEDDRRYTWG